MIKVLAVTGIRSEYDILYPIIDTLRKDKNFEVMLAVGGAHLSDFHGNMLEKIESDGFVIADKLDYLLMTNRKTQRAKGVGMLTYSLCQTVDRENPDYLFVVGDREESIATAIVGNYTDTLVAHLGGGDPVYGNADDPIRFAVSKLSHVHFTTAKQYSENLLKLSEEDFRVFWVGNPAFDNIRTEPSISFEEINQYLQFPIEKEKYIVFLKHPLSSEKEDAYNQMKISLAAIEEFCKESQLKAVGIFPNTDPGSYDIVNAINEFSGSSHIKFFKTIPRTIFINIMRNCLALAGNSSMGILEAPFYKLPVVNIGNRQRGRLNAGNVEFVDHKKEEIIKGLQKACFDISYRNKIKNLENPFGDGYTGVRIKDALLSIDRKDPKWYVKKKLI